MKKANLIVIGAILIGHALYGQNYKPLIRQADSLYRIKEYAKALEVFKQAFILKDSNYADFYNSACDASLARKPDEAFKWLDMSITYGWNDIDHLKADNDLVSLHSDPRWNGAINKLQKIDDSIEANYDKPVVAELRQIYKDDQEPRLKFIDAGKKFGYDSPTTDSLGEIMRFHDSINLIKVTQILDTKGWLGKDKIGGKGIQTEFLVIQHSDLKVQEKYLPMMREAVKNHQLSKGSFALLEDRVALREGKKQIYGSQLGYNNELNKQYVCTLEDPDNVDKRRSEVGLEPMADYVNYFGLTWNLEEYKKQLPQIEEWDKKNYPQPK